MPFLEVKQLHKSYEKAPLLNGVTFTVAKGEIACLLGPSGSGKTTLLRLIAGLETMEKGSINLEGKEITNLPPHRRGIVLMFQEYALFPHRTVAENIAFGLRMQRIPHAAQTTRIAEMLSLVGLEGFDRRDINALSGGERQRVALARSLAPRPQLLLLDEPLGALDRNLRERLLEDLPVILRNVGVTAITVTHDQEEALALADRIILLHEGRTVQAGPPNIIYDTPVNAWAARFLGLDNLFPATVSPNGGLHTALGPLVFPQDIALPPPGSSGLLLIHPWGIHLETGPVNQLTGRLAHAAYHGAFYRLQLEFPGGTLTLTQSSAQPPAFGPLTCWIDPAALRWLDE